MKTAIILAAGAAALVNAKPHGHAHLHRHQKREPDAVTTIQGPVATALAFMLNGQAISQDEVCNGIASGELKWDGDAPAGACAAASSIAVPTTTTTVTSSSATETPSSSAAGAQFFAQSASPASSSSSSAPASTSSAAAPSSSSTSSTSTANGVLGTVSKFTSSLAKSSYGDFPDGTLKCSDGPPTAYGAIPVDYLNRGGWAGLQQLNSAFNAIENDASSCTDGVSCSFACAPGYQNLQWVESQPSNGASIGGLLCKGGLLYRANSNQQLCGAGTGGVSVSNSAGSGISVCRTNYPGPEDETIPLDVETGDTQPLTCPDESTYYKHLGASTSAQYYLNQPGVGATDGCKWDGLNDKQSGNWAPINLGVGYSSGTKWLSIFQNSPTSNAVFQGSVNITGGSTSCSYTVDADGKDGEYCGGGTCCKVSSGNNCGCTVSASGEAEFVVSA